MLLIPILLPILGGAVVLTQPERRAKVLSYITVIGSALMAVFMAFVLTPPVFTGPSLVADMPMSFAMDDLGKFFVVLVALVFSFVLIYAPPYIHHEGKASQFYGFYAITFGTLMAVCLSQNALTFYMSFEFMSLFSMPLVLHNGSGISRLAAFKYLGYSTLGASLALLGLFMAYGSLGSLTFTAGGVDLNPGHESVLLVAYFLIFLGFGAKAGLTPLQMWLTEAHPVAPSPASAVLSGIITKSGVLAILRFTYYLFGADFLRGKWPQKVLLVMALATVFLGSMLAFKEKVLKKRMAYSTISNVSYVLFGILTMTLTGYTGALLQVVFHALAKDILFMAAGAVILATGYTKVSQLKGIGRRMPVTMWCFTIAALSLIGIPPLGGFVSKWYLCLGGFEGSDILGIVGMAVLMISALLTAFYLLSITAEAFFPGRDVKVGDKCEVSWQMRIPMIVFSVLLVVLGLCPGVLTQITAALGALIM